MASLVSYVMLWLIETSFCMVRVWDIFISVAWRLNGVESKWRDIVNGDERKFQAQVLHNWFTIPFSAEITSSSLITTHECFAPSSILQRPNVHLLSVGKDVVKFLEMDPSVEPLNVRKNPILFIAQTRNVQKLIVTPRWVFDRLVAGLDDQDTEVVWLFHSIRCGSTLWAQIFYSLPNWTVISETQAMLHSLIHASNVTDVEAFSKTPEYEEMVVAIIKSYLSLVPKGNSVFWKVGLITENMVPIIHKRFPNHRIMFSYRDVFPSAKSQHRLISTIPIYEHKLRQVKREINNPSPTGDSRVGRMLWTGGCYPEICVRAIGKSDLYHIVFEWFMLQWAVRIKSIMDQQSTGITIKCVKYDDLRTDAKGTITKVFSDLGISLDLVDTGLKAMEHDSQEGINFLLEKRSKEETWIRDGTESRCDAILSEFGLSGLHSAITMEDTL